MAPRDWDALVAWMEARDWTPREVQEYLDRGGYLNGLADDILAINRANGWEVLTTEDWAYDRRIPTSLCLIHSEVSEALEGFRIGDRANVAEELADVLIRVLDMMGGLGIDVDAEVSAKMERNRSRGFRHGGKVI